MKAITSLLLAVGLFAGILNASAADEKAGAAKPYKLDTCAVSDEKLGEMGKPYVFEHNGQEIKLCCKSCKKDFDKNPDKYLKKMAEKEKKAAAKADKDAHAGHNH